MHITICHEGENQPQNQVLQGVIAEKYFFNKTKLAILITLLHPGGKFYKKNSSTFMKD